MKTATNAGKQPAASSLATQVQSRTLRHVGNCPFCAYADRKVAADVSAMVAAREQHGGPLHVLLHERADQQLIAFGDDAKTQPCRHLVLAWGRCLWWDGDGSGGESPSCVEFDLNHAVISAQPNSGLEVFLEEKVVTRTCGRRFLPATPVHHRTIRKQWREPARSWNPARLFQLTMWSYFSPDPARLIVELAAKTKEYQQHCTAVERAASSR